jgi:hypothetical protein
VPKAALVLILIVWFGIGVGPGILTAFLISFFPITVNMATGWAHRCSQGEKWESDAAVRQGMESIRLALAANQERIDKGQLSAKDYQRLGSVIDKNLADIVKNRTVTKEAAKAFHLVIVIDLNHDLELMRAGHTVQLQRTGALGALQSLRHNGDYFQHPGWPLSAVKAK